MSSRPHGHDMQPQLQDPCPVPPGGTGASSAQREAAWLTITEPRLALIQGGSLPLDSPPRRRPRCASGARVLRRPRLERESIHVAAGLETTAVALTTAAEYVQQAPSGRAWKYVS